MVTQMTELLAPAGDISCAYAAINGGADAVYIGLKSFSARASADNFGEDELSALCMYAHALGVRVHVALNTLVKESEVEGFVKAAISAQNAGADALIIQDIFLGKYLKSQYPALCLHLSTQAGTNNVYGARLAKEYGFDRVILARETPIQEIEKITKIIETETFVQGALCTCFSGQCYLSSFAGGNSGNRGRCKQPCRKLYSIDRDGFRDSAYRLSLSDLSVGENISKLVEAGVYSFKIEGRMRRPEYVSAAVRYYRAILDGHSSASDLSALKRTYNRGNYTHGLAFGQDKSFISSAVQGHIGEFCGTVKVIGGKYVCMSAEQCAEGDCFKILRAGKEVGGATFGGRAGKGFYLSSGTRLLNGDKVFITTDASVNRQLLEGRKLKKTVLSVYISEGSPLKAVVNGREYFGDYVPASAVSRAVSTEDIKKCFLKIDTYPFSVEFADINISGSPFVPASALNEFRRTVYKDYYLSVGSLSRERIDKIYPVPAARAAQKNTQTAVIARDLRGVKADIGIYKPDDYRHIDLSKTQGFCGRKFLFLPPFFTSGAAGEVLNALSSFDGVYCDGYWAIEYCRLHNIALFAGCGFNIGNSLSLSEVEAEYIALSKELTSSEAQPLADANTFYLSAGDIKVMDLIYCPFGKSCKTCDKRERYTLTDESGRAFPMRRYSDGECRFELFNCVPLVAAQAFTGTLCDCTVSDPIEVSALCSDGEGLRKYFKNYTSGHIKNPVL